MIQEQQLAHELHLMGKITNIVLDTSTLIHISRFNLMSKITPILEIHIPQGVKKEFGSPPETLGTLIIENKSENLPVDDQVLSLALELSCPVLSEDRKILQKAETQGLEFYNFGLLLILLVLKKALSFDEGYSVWEAFGTTNPYHKDIRDYCEELFHYIQRKT